MRAALVPAAARPARPDKIRRKPISIAFLAIAAALVAVVARPLVLELHTATIRSRVPL
jgi:hypothetical protein